MYLTSVTEKDEMWSDTEDEITAPQCCVETVFVDGKRREVKHAW